MSVGCPTCGQGVEAARVSIHGMYDCHLFHRIEARSVDEVIAAWEQHNREEADSRYGPSNLCPAIVLAESGKEIRRVGKMVFPPRSYRPDNSAEVAAYRAALLADPDIPRLLATPREGESQ